MFVSVSDGLPLRETSLLISSSVQSSEFRSMGMAESWVFTGGTAEQERCLSYATIGE